MGGKGHAAQRMKERVWPMKYIMDTIVAVDAAWGIGKHNDLLFSIPEDLKFFRETTLGSIIILGRKNLESFPGGKPLPKRKNIVLSGTLEQREGYLVCRSLEEVFRLLAAMKDNEGSNGLQENTAGTCTREGKQEEEEAANRVFVIGGAQVYEEFLPYCRFAYVTKMYRDFHAEVFFPDLDRHPDWVLSEEGEMREYQGVQYQYTRYENRRIKRFGDSHQTAGE